MTIWLDLTSSLRWMHHPVGIIRCEHEIARRILARDGGEIKFCRFVGHGGPVVEVESNVVQSLLHEEGKRAPAAKGLQRSLSILRKVHRRLHGDSVRREDFPFRDGDTYVSIGMDAWDRDLARIGRLKAILDLRVVTACYDLIPVRFPHLVNDAERIRLPHHFRLLADISDVVLCVSDHTLEDFRAFVREQGLPDVVLSRIRLGAEIAPVTEAIPAGGEIHAEPFILYVSSLSGRKNHDLMYRVYAWAGRLGIHLPRMVWVGRAGVESRELLRFIAENPAVKGRILHLPNASDSEVHWLYRHCLFTVFPSLAEGWGLPVAESTLYQKPCLASNLDSVIEIAGELHEYLDPHSTDQWLSAIQRLSLDYGERSARTERIRGANWRRNWTDAVDDLLIACEIARRELRH